MSVEAMSWALRAPVGGNLKVILIGLANHAHPDGTEAYPSLNTLALYACCDRSTARRNLRRLELDGWIIRDGEGPKGTAKWRLPMDREVPSAGGWQFATPGGDLPPGGGTGARGGVAPAPPEPSIEPMEGEEGAREHEQLDAVIAILAQAPGLVIDRRAVDDALKARSDNDPVQIAHIVASWAHEGGLQVSAAGALLMKAAEYLDRGQARVAAAISRDAGRYAAVRDGSRIESA